MEEISTNPQLVQITELESLRQRIAELEHKLFTYKQTPPQTLDVIDTVFQADQVQPTLYRQTEKFKGQENEAVLLASHELRAPLTSIKGFAELVEDNLQKQTWQNASSNPTEKEDENTRHLQERNLQAIGNILRQVEYMEKLIEHFLNVSEDQEVGPTIKARSVLTLGKLLQQLVEQRTLPAAQHSFKVQLKLSEEEQTRLLVAYDEVQLQQVLDNLVNNAIKYSPVGTTITLGLGQYLDPGEVIVEVSDEGYGISLEAQEHLFEQFYREENERVANTKGWGIGLYLCWQIILQHRGRIWLETEPGRGSTFYFALPICT